MNGIEKEIDALGRIVIPVKFRKRLGIELNSKVFISLENEVIVISGIDKYCALCGDKIKSKSKFRLCNRCILEIKSEN